MARVFTDAGAMKLLSSRADIADYGGDFSVAFWHYADRDASRSAIISVTDGTAAVPGGAQMTNRESGIQADFPFATGDKIRNSTTAPALKRVGSRLVTHSNTGLASTDFTFYFNGKQEIGTRTSPTGRSARFRDAAAIEIGASAGDGADRSAPMNRFGRDLVPRAFCRRSTRAWPAALTRCASKKARRDLGPR
jgi:hypothetical protein